MTEYKESVMLARYGTLDVALPPSAILAVAREDFARRQRNKLAEPPYERFAFLVGHVRNAKSPSEIMQRALAWKRHQPKAGALAAQGPAPKPKLSLLRLTASVENLSLAIQIAEEAND